MPHSTLIGPFQKATAQKKKTNASFMVLCGLSGSFLSHKHDRDTPGTRWDCWPATRHPPARTRETTSQVPRKTKTGSRKWRYVASLQCVFCVWSASWWNTNLLPKGVFFGLESTKILFLVASTDVYRMRLVRNSQRVWIIADSSCKKFHSLRSNNSAKMEVTRQPWSYVRTIQANQVKRWSYHATRSTSNKSDRGLPTPDEIFKWSWPRQHPSGLSNLWKSRHLLRSHSSSL